MSQELYHWIALLFSGAVPIVGDDRSGTSELSINTPLGTFHKRPPVNKTQYGHMAHIQRAWLCSQYATSTVRSFIINIIIIARSLARCRQFLSLDDQQDRAKPLKGTTFYFNRRSIWHLMVQSLPR